MSRQRTKKIRHRLFKENPFCFWCGKETLLLDREGGSAHADEATLEHLFDKFDERRYQEGGNKVVIACYLCNFNRGKQRARLYFERTGFGDISAKDIRLFLHDETIDIRLKENPSFVHTESGCANISPKVDTDIEYLFSEWNSLING
jgi:hypothetical protein